MKLSDIIAKLTGLESQVAASSFKAELSELQSVVNSTLATLESDLATAKASIESLGKEKAELNGKLETLSTAVAGTDTKLNEALSALKLETKSDATAVEKISAIQSSVADSLAKLGVNPAALPNPAPNAGGLASDTNKTMVMAEFNKLSPQAKMSFVKAGGKLTE